MMFKNFYVFVGLDGSGKSSTIDELLKIYADSRSFHFIPKFNNVTNTNDIKSKKNLKTPSSHLIRILSIFRVIKNLLISWFFIPFNSFKSKYLFGDRYVYGYYTEPIPLKFYLGKKLSLKLISLFPKPHKIFYLEINEEMSKHRKDELNMTQIQTVRENIENLSTKMNNIVKIDAEYKNINELVDEIRRYIK